MNFHTYGNKSEKSPSQFHFLNTTDPLNIFEVYVSITKSEKTTKIENSVPTNGQGHSTIPSSNCWLCG